jgi:5-oxoprolinase (ATP-hydrolysing)
VLIHPLAGVLSAFGMGLADLRHLTQESLEQPLSPQALGAAADRFVALEDAALDALVAQGAEAGTVTHNRRLLVRYAGTDTPLEVPFGDEDGVAAAFDALHRRQFGFAEERQRVVGALSLESIAPGGDAVLAGPTTTGKGDGNPVAVRRVFTGGRWQDTPVHERRALPAGAGLDGPALIVEENATTLVMPGWSAVVQRGGDILMEARGAGCGTTRSETAADPILLEVFNNLYMHIAEQMGVILEKTAHSVNIKERLDFSCAVFDPNGGLVANAPHMPVHLGSMGESVRSVIARFGGMMSPGDSFVLNAPYGGGTHLPDVTVVSPSFLEADADRPLFYVASRAHHADIGGVTPGSMPPSLRAQLAANARGLAELDRMLSRYGADTVRAYMGHVQDNAEEAVRRAIGRLRSGSFSYELDGGERIRVSIEVDRATRSARVDFSGTSPQSKTNFNAPMAVCRAAVLYVFRTLVDHDIPMNEGCLRPIDLRVPEGSLLNPRPPAAVVAGNVETSQCIVDALYGALGELAASQGTMNNLTFGNDRYQYYETICGGAGAGPGFDGASAVHTHMTNSRLTDPEVLESRYPVILRSFRIREGSGGSGRFRGGDGAIREIEFREDMAAGILSNHRRVAPFGLAGGEPGAVGRNRLRRADGGIADLGGTASADVGPGDVMIIETPGGGGFGEPADGEPSPTGETEDER